MPLYWVLGLGMSLQLLASVRLSPVPRKLPNEFLKELSYSGGTHTQANIDGIRTAYHFDGEFERWVVDFSKELGGQSVAPPFRLTYKSFSIVLYLAGVRRVSLAQATLQKLTSQSRFLKDIVVYPPIEQGEQAIEFLLKKPALLRVFQPLLQEGRIVMDFKPEKMNGFR